MSFNGSGTFQINTAGQPVVANTVISATVFNALTADLANGLSTCITKDGQTTITANIPFGGNKITTLGAGTAATDAANLGQVQSTAAKLITVTGTDTITGSMSPQLTAYAAGQLLYFIANAANTGAVTINVDGLGAKAITRDGSTALAAGDINSGEVVVIVYDGTRFQMINAANSFGNTTINGTLTVTGNTGLQANVSITSALSVGGVFAVTGAATLGSTLEVTGKSDLPTVSTASMNAAVAVVTTGTVTNLTATSASVASMNAGVALLTTATVTTLTATGASIASANIGNLQFTAASIASINAGVAVITNLTVTGASIASMNGSVANITTVNATTVDATNVEVTNVKAKDGTAAATIADSTGVVSLTANPVLSGGTANGVLYLDGSKVATSGSALTFDGTTFGVTSTWGSNSQLFTNATASNLSGITARYSGVNKGYLYFDNSTSLYNLYGEAGISLAFTANAAEGMRLTSTGLGIGTASPASALVVNQTVDSGTARIDLQNTGAGGSTDYSEFRLLSTAGTARTAVFRMRNNIEASIGSVTNDPFTFITNNTERARIDASGNLGIGTTSPLDRLDVVSGSSTNRNRVRNSTSDEAFFLFQNSTTGTTTSSGLAVGIDSSENAYLYNYINSPLIFATNATERARITAGGYFKASSTGTYSNSTGSYHELRSSGSNDWIAYFQQTAATGPNGVVIEYTAAAPNGTGNTFLYCQDNAAVRATIRSNGGLANYQSNNVDLSDARTKNSITPAASMWGKIGALEIVTYKYNDQTHDDVNLGVIAQQVESVDPVWVDADGFSDTPEGEEPLKTVYTKDITFAAIKALQEAMARIEKLEAEVAAMKGVA